MSKLGYKLIEVITFYLGSNSLLIQTFRTIQSAGYHYRRSLNAPPSPQSRPRFNHLLCFQDQSERDFGNVLVGPSFGMSYS